MASSHRVVSIVSKELLKFRGIPVQLMTQGNSLSREHPDLVYLDLLLSSLAARVCLASCPWPQVLFYSNSFTGDLGESRDFGLSFVVCRKIVHYT